MGVFKTICEYLGKNNDASIAVVAIALFKGIFRPTFTMMDKHQDPESKKYAAFREGVTELIAIPSYLLIPLAFKQLAGPLAGKVKNNNIPKPIENAKKTLSFIGVCFAALFAIPFLCNKLLKPIMDAFQKRQLAKKAKKEGKANLNVIVGTEPQNPVIHTNPVKSTHNLNNPKGYLDNYVNDYFNSRNSGMRVGN